MTKSLSILDTSPNAPLLYLWTTGKDLLEFMGGLSGINEESLKQRMNELLDLVGLSKEKDRRIETYSGGMKERLGIAQALIHQPKLLIMDEPVSALDPLGRRGMLEFLKLIKQNPLFFFHVYPA